jgi:sec-independent protein translocase protein TatB
VFDLSLPKLLVPTVIALVIFGPNELPTIASQAGHALRDLRQIAEGAKDDLREGLGPEFADFEIEDLNPKRFVQKHLSGDLNADQGAQQQPARQAAANGTPSHEASDSDAGSATSAACPERRCLHVTYSVARWWWW